MGKNIHKGIVIVNEFTINGSRGHSPGNYVLEYMARDNASENMTPTIPRREYIEKLSEDMLKRHKKKIDNQTGKGEPNPSDYVTRYMARESATEKLSLDGAIRISELEEEFDELQGMSGVAFSRDNISLSHNDVKKMSKMIQSEYEKKKPVFKTVISFDTEYLKEMGVLPEDVEIKKRGDLYGKADQAKLRLAIQHGLKNIKSEFSDLDYIGVIQVDTMHLHCHLAMVDKGLGKRFTKKGEQKGMLSTNMMAAIRRGIDNSLDQQSLIKPLSIQMDSEKRNTVGFIKRFAYKVMEERGTLQYLLACLPKDDKSLWKASINTDGGKDGVMEIQKKGNKKKYVKGNMKKANEILRSHVIDLINRPDSGFREALQAEHDYLIARKNRGDFNNYQMYKTRTINDKKKSVLVRLTPDEAVREEEEKFKETIITNGMNAVYDILKNVDDKTVTLHTPLLDAMSMPYEEMANHVKDNKLIEFGFKLRSYGSRLEYHKDSYHKVNQVIHQYEDGDQTTYNPESKVLYDFLKVERDYNHAVMCKYQTFLHFYHSQTEYAEQYEDVQFLRTRSKNRHAMREDKALLKHKLEIVEKLGKEKYGLSGASLIIMNPGAYDQQMRLEDIEYEKGLRNFKETLAECGLLYDDKKDIISKGLQYDFDDVKAYDLHHMTYDFTYDFKIASINVDNFVKMANKRYDAYEKALDYLKKTNQENVFDSIINKDDILLAKQLADEFRKTGNVYRSKFDGSELVRHNPATIRLDNDIYSELSNKNVMKSLQEIIQDMEKQYVDDISVEDDVMDNYPGYGGRRGRKKT